MRIFFTRGPLRGPKSNHPNPKPRAWEDDAPTACCCSGGCHCDESEEHPTKPDGQADSAECPGCHCD